MLAFLGETIGSRLTIFLLTLRMLLIVEVSGCYSHEAQPPEHHERRQDHLLVELFNVRTFVRAVPSVTLCSSV